MRINRFLCLCGYGSRRKVEDLIKNGAVTVNNSNLKSLAYQVADSDEVRVRDTLCTLPACPTYVLFNKPVGFLCSRKDLKHRPLIYDLLPDKYQKLHYVGRLDLNSRGLLLLTDDGYFTQKLSHPSFQIPRTYQVKTHPKIRKKHKDCLLKGLKLENEILKASSIKLGGEYAEITLKEGKNREIRKMMEAFGIKILDLKRVSFGPFLLDGLKEGKLQILKKDEIDLLNCE